MSTPPFCHHLVFLPHTAAHPCVPAPLAGSTQCRASGMSVCRPANWPARRNDRFWHFSCAAPVIIVASCCFSVGCDLSLGAVPPLSVAQLADSDTVVLMTHCFA